MKLNLTKFQQNQYEIVDPILEWEDDGTMAKVIVSYLSVTPMQNTLRYRASYGPVTACVLSSTDEVIVTGHANGMIRIMDTTTGHLLRTLEGHAEKINSVCLFSDDLVLVSASSDHTLRTWTLATGDCTTVYTDTKWNYNYSPWKGHTKPVWDCCVPSTDDFIVSASGDKTLKLWRTRLFYENNTYQGKGACFRTLRGHKSSVRACSMSATNTFIVSASRDKTIKLWDVSTGECTRTLSGHQAGIVHHGCCLDLADQCIFTVDFGTTLKVWDIARGTCTHTVPNFGHLICLSPDGQHVVAINDGSNELKTWTKATSVTYTRNIDHPVLAMCVSSANDFIVCGTNDAVCIRETDTLSLYPHD